MQQLVFAGHVTCVPLSVAVMHIAWHSEDKPFAVGYADGKLLIGSKEPLEKGAIVVIDAHKVTGANAPLRVGCFQLCLNSVCLRVRSPSPA